MKRENGFSLIELIVVIAMIGVISTVVVLNVQSGRYANIERCSENVELLLSELKQTVLSNKDDWYLIIYQAADSNYYAVITKDKDSAYGISDGKQIGSSSVTISGVDYAAQSHIVEYDDSNPTNSRLVISYKKSTGAFQDVGVTCYRTIKLSRGDMAYEVHLVKETGKCYRRKV